MIIKAKAAADSGEWLMFDNCSEVGFDTTLTEVTDSNPDYQDLFGYADELHVIVDAFTGKGEPHRLIRWVRWVAPLYERPGDAGTHLLVTDQAPVFILNDSGETIDRV